MASPPAPWRAEPAGGGRVSLLDAGGAKLATCRDRAVADAILGAVNATAPGTGGKYPADFQVLWKAWPPEGRKNKGDACRAYKTLAGTRPSLETLLAAVRVLKRSKKWQEGFIPYLGTALRGHYWNDAEVEAELEAGTDAERLAAGPPPARPCVRCVLYLAPQAGDDFEPRPATLELPAAVRERAAGCEWGRGAPVCGGCWGELGLEAEHGPAVVTNAP